MNQDDESWAEDGDDMEEMHPAVEVLKPAYVLLMQKRMELEEAGIDNEERRAGVEGIFKEQIRLAFLTHAMATEEDFNPLP